MVPTAGSPRQGHWARSASYPFGDRLRDVPEGSLRLRSRALRAAVVVRVWTECLTPPVFRTVRLAAGLSADALGLFCMDAVTSPCGLADATPGWRVCVWVCVCVCVWWPGTASRPPGSVLLRLSFALAVLFFFFVFSAPSWLGFPL